MGIGAEAAGAVVLAGGRSSRMGTPKAALEWHGSTLLHRTTALLARTVGGPVVVVAAPGQDLPALPAGVTVVEDPVEGRGPMQGIAGGLGALAEKAPAAFVCSTDLPFLHPAYVRRVLGALGDTDAAVPLARGFRQPLAAGYRTALGEIAAALAAEGSLKLGRLFERCRVRWLTEDDLLADPDVARHDPHLDSLVNVNEPADYAAARARPPADVVVECVAAPASRGRRGPVTAPVATLGAAAAAVGLDLDRHVVALNGDRTGRDPHIPLVSGDRVSFLPADAAG
ncbi:molybdenum cofactor guanylyltransferase [Pseudonocardia sp. CNS-139]|nr:molybdenum cofactor guanylyltransferase [Pseudonocardia sp. CNS-139]